MISVMGDDLAWDTGSSEILRMSSDQGVVKYGILQLPGSDELDTHVAHGRTHALAQGVVHIGHKSKGFDDSLIQIPIERSRNAAHLISSHLRSVVDG